MSAGTVHVVARGAWWTEGDWEHFRPLSVTGRSWEVSEGLAALPADAIDALEDVLRHTAGRGRGRSVVRPIGAGRWTGATNDDFVAEPGRARLVVELTADELKNIYAGNMDRAVYTRLTRAEAAGVSYPENFTDPLPMRCKVSMRGRHGAKRGFGATAPAAATPAAAPAGPVTPPAPALAPITRKNGELYYPRDMGDGRTDVELIRQLHLAGRSALLKGQPGTGKTALLEAALPDHVYIAGTSDTEAIDFVGTFVPDPSATPPYRWVDGPLLVAMEEGLPLIIDEVALIDPRALSIVYAATDGRRTCEVSSNPLRGTVTAIAGFGVHCACNPDAPGADMSEALTSRMTLQIEYGTDYALAQKLGAPARLVTAARNLDKKRQEGEITWSPQMRELLGFVTVKKLFGEVVALSNLVGSAPIMDQPLVADVLQTSIGAPIAALRIGEVTT